MKATSLFLTAVFVAGVTCGMVPRAHSQAATNSINVTVPANGFALVGNPLNRGSNTLSEVLPDVPNVTTLAYELRQGNYISYRKFRVGWAGPEGVAFDPGKGFFVQNASASAIILTFVGGIPQGTQTINIVPGYNLLGSHFPFAGKVETDLGLPAVKGDKVLKFDPSQSYVLYTRRATGWSPTEPVIGVAEGFFFVTTNTVSWTRTYNPPRP
jgi:hypothetical protein